MKRTKNDSNDEAEEDNIEGVCNEEEEDDEDDDDYDPFEDQLALYDNKLDSVNEVFFVRDFLS